MTDKCEGCGKQHNFEDCPNREAIKEIVIARLETMPSNITISIG